MPTKQLNARDLIAQVSDMASPEVWVEIGFLTEAEIDYSANEETADTTTFEDDGSYAQEVMQRGASMTLKGRAAADTTTGVREPGQAQMNLHADLTGPDSQVHMRFRYPSAATWVTWTATITRAAEGGGNNDKVGYEYKVTRCGAAGSAAVA